MKRYAVRFSGGSVGTYDTTSKAKAKELAQEAIAKGEQFGRIMKIVDVANPFWSNELYAR